MTGQVVISFLRVYFKQEPGHKDDSPNVNYVKDTAVKFMTSVFEVNAFEQVFEIS